MEHQDYVEYQTRPRRFARWALVASLLLLGAGMAIIYFIHARLESAYQELETSYAAQQEKGKRLAQKAGELSKALEEAQARVNALKKKQRLSEQEKGKLAAKGKRLETDLKRLRPAYLAEQAKGKKLAQEAKLLAKAVEEALARVEDLQESQDISEQEKGKLKTKVAKVETALQVLQKAYIAEQVKNKKLAKKAREFSKTTKKGPAGEKAQAQKKRADQAQAQLKELGQIRAQVKALQESQRAAEKQKDELKAEGTKLETKAQHLQTAYDAEKAKTDMLIVQGAEMIGLIIRLRAETVKLHHMLGISYNRLGLSGEALRAFQMALELDPDHADSRFEMARVYVELGDRESAAAQLRRFVRLRPEAEDAERIKGWLIRVEAELGAKKRAKAWPEGATSEGSSY